jgi:hypothetical protein
MTDMSTDKKEPEGSDDSMDSTKVEALERLQVRVVTQKRKGGRKPVISIFYITLPNYFANNIKDICYFRGTQAT